MRPLEELPEASAASPQTWGDPLYQEKYLKLSKLVTENEVSRVIRKYLIPSNATVTVLMPAEEMPDFKGVTAHRYREDPTRRRRLRLKPRAEATGIVTRTLSNGIRRWC